VTALFHTARAEEYEDVVRGSREVLAQLDRAKSAHRASLAQVRAKLEGLKRELDRIESIDHLEFDILGAEFGHHGEDCTFETLVKRFGVNDRRLRVIAEIVHEADLHDGKFARTEARGVDLAIKGLAESTGDDHELLERGMAIFDGLYTVLKRKT